MITNRSFLSTHFCVRNKRLRKFHIIFVVYSFILFGNTASDAVEVKPQSGDSYSTIQAALDSACVSAGKYGAPAHVFLTAGRYFISKPIFLSCNHLEFSGTSKTETVIYPTFEGPAIWMSPEIDGLHYGEALVGHGRSFKTEETDVLVNLRDAQSMELDGLESFTAEAFVKATSAYKPGYGGVVQSFGCTGTGKGKILPGCTSAFSLGMSVQDLVASLTTRSREVVLRGPRITDERVHHIAITYDGQLARLFLDGQSVAEQKLTGPIFQRLHEDVTLGYETKGFEGPAQNGAMPGYIDSVRISKSARYVSRFSPPKDKLVADSNSLILVNFEKDSRGMVGATRGEKTSIWLPIRRRYLNGKDFPYLGGISIHDLKIDGGMGILGWFSTNSHLFNLNCANCDYGVAMLGNNYEGHFDRIDVEAGSSRGRFGLLSVTANGNEFSEIRLSGQRVPFVVMGGSEQVVDHLKVEPNLEKSEYALYLQATSTLLKDLEVHFPKNASFNTQWKSSIVSVEPWAILHILGGKIEGHGTRAIVDGGVGAIVDGANFKNISNEIHTVKKKRSHQRWDVQKSGARPGDFDSFTSIQKAVDAACASGGGEVFFPSGTYYVSRPIHLHCNSIEVNGEGLKDTRLINYTGTSGPVFLARAANENQTWLNLRDSPAVELNGLKALTVEAWTRAGASQDYVLQSRGCLGSGKKLGGCHTAFGLYVKEGRISAELSAGERAEFHGPKIGSERNHHLALSYNGVEAFFFLDGKLIESHRLKGPISQEFYEDVSLGVYTSGFDEVENHSGAYPELRISQVSRYENDFSTLKNQWSMDSDTLVQLNTSEKKAGTVSGKIQGGQFYFPLRGGEKELNRLSIHHLTVGKGGIFGWNVRGSHYSDLYLLYSDMGIILEGKASGSSFEDIVALSGKYGRYGMLIQNGDGNTYHNLSLTFQTLPLVLIGGKRQSFLQLFIAPNYETTRYGMIASKAGTEINGLYFDSEGKSSVWRGDLALVNAERFFVHKGEFDNMQSGGVPITIENGKEIRIESSSFGFSKSAGQLIYIDGDLDEKIRLVGITKDSDTIFSNKIEKLSIDDNSVSHF